MVVTKRERTYLLATAVLVGVFLLNYAVVQPFLNYRAQLKTDLASARKDVDDAQVLFNRQSGHEKDWKAMTGSSFKSSPSEAESQVLHSVRDWAQESGLGLESLKPEHSVQDKESTFQDMGFRASGTGSMAALARMLWRLETAQVPLHVNSVQITPRKEATDDLTVQLSISTVCLNPEPPKAPSTPRAAPQEDLH